MKIRALKDSPLAKQGEVFESDKNFYNYFNFSNNLVGKELMDRFIKDGWFEIVDERESLSDKLNTKSNVFLYPSNINVICNIAREHAIEIVKEADIKCFDVYENRASLSKNYIIQKLEEQMR